MKRNARKLIIFGAIILPLYAILVLCMLSGNIITSYYGFAFDNNGLLYVGEDHKINAYDKGEFVRTVYEPVRGYYFTIQDEKLYVTTVGAVIEMDLIGNFIEKKDDVGSIEMRRLRNQQNVFVTDDARYAATGVLGYYKIIKYSNNGGSETVYQSSIFIFVLQIVGTIGFLSFIIVFLVEHHKRIHLERENEHKNC